jgi:CRP/FNR family transcriptional regulator, cyclic AMP receptor protein
MTMSNLTQLLADNPVFAHLAESEREQLAQQATRKRYSKGEWIAQYGDTWPYLFVVATGTVHASKESSEGRSLIVLTLEPGDIFWGMAFFLENAMTPVLLQAQTPCEFYLWSRDQLLPWLWENGRVSWELSCLMVQRMLRASQIVEELAFQPVRGRLARLLLERYGGAVNDFVARDLTLDEIAAHVGTKREMVCRLLYEFAEEGTIEISRTEFMITDWRKLKGHAQSAKG